MYHVPCIMYHVSCTMYHVPCIMYHVSCIMYHVSCIMYHVSCTMYHVSCIVYDIQYTYDSSILPLTHLLEPYNINSINSRQNINNTVYDTIIRYNGKNKSSKYKTYLYYIEILYIKIEAKFIKKNSLWHMISFLLYIDCSKKQRSTY
jgi:hypothetical protein